MKEKIETMLNELDSVETLKGCISEVLDMQDTEGLQNICIALLFFCVKDKPYFEQAVAELNALNIQEFSLS